MDVRYITLTKGNLKVTFSSLGAAIVSIYFDDELMTLTPISAEDFKRRDIYYGKTIGPVVNRIKDGLIKIDNKEYHFPLNEEGICNHSGNIGLSNILFVSSVAGDRVVFTYQQKINDIRISYGIAYTLLDNNQLRVDYITRASGKFVMSLTNHTFFTLGESSIDNLSLKISADKYIESDKETLLPLSEKAIIDCLDFNEEKSVIKDISNPYLMEHKTKGYDHCFLVKNNEEVILKSPKFSLEIESDFPCVHLYSDNYEDGVKTKNSIAQVRRGIAIEPEDNLLNRPIINSNDIYQRYIIYKFSRL